MSATITIPKSGPCPESRHDGLSDALAMSFGRRAARTLSEQDGYVTVMLESGSVRVIGHDTVTGELTIGRLHPNYRTYQERECYGT